MSPPEIWGPAVWTLFHTLTERINEYYYPYISSKLFLFIIRICKFLPCPDCSNDSTKFLAKIKFSDLKTKDELKNTLYLFHNWVNNKKKKNLFNYSHLEIYKRYNLINVVNNFINKYQTKGNMNLITESFQRDVIIKDFKSWFINSIKAFITVINIPKVLTPEILTKTYCAIEEQHESIEEEQHESNIVEEEHESNIVLVEEEHESNVVQEEEESNIILVEEEEQHESNIVEEKDERNVVLVEEEDERNVVEEEDESNIVLVQEESIVEEEQEQEKTTVVLEQHHESNVVEYSQNVENNNNKSKTKRKNKKNKK